jgi:hypothetical protein
MGRGYHGPTMRIRLLSLILICLALVAFGAVAWAQLGFEQTPKMPATEQTRTSSKVLDTIDAGRGSVRRQLAAARDARDVVKTLCLNDKLTQLDVLAKTAQDRHQQLLSAIQAHDTELTNHQYALVTILGTRAHQLIAEANQCIGEEFSFMGQTTMGFTAPEGLPPDTVTDVPATPPGDFGSIPAGPPMPASAGMGP